MTPPERPRYIPDPLATPDFFPMSMNLERNSLRFVSVSRDSLRRSACLDARYTVRTATTTVMADIPKLLARQPRCPLQFILHGAFCGSTLLARYLEELPHCLVLKEPEILGQISALRDDRLAADEAALWRDRFNVVVAMLARPCPSDNAVVVKASSTCNWLGHALLDHDGSSRIVFMSSPLRTFLLQVLKSHDRRQWLHQHMNFLRKPMAQVAFLEDAVNAELTDGQRAAAMWLVNSFLCQSLLARSDSNRILTLHGEDLISRPRETVLAAADFLGVIHDDADRSALDVLIPSSQHAKDPSQSFDAVSHTKELADAARTVGGEVEAAMSWARSVAAGWLAQSPFPTE